MDKNEVIKYLKIERECISRNCDRNCGECDLVQEQETLLDAYNSAIVLLTHSCDECMHDAPFQWCCKQECGEHAFCKGCTAISRGGTCPQK